MRTEDEVRERVKLQMERMLNDPKRADIPLDTEELVRRGVFAIVIAELCGYWESSESR